LYVRSGSSGMVSSTTTSVGGLQTSFELEDIKYVVNS
jgi:hypothetical protein